MTITAKGNHEGPAGSKPGRGATPDIGPGEVQDYPLSTDAALSDVTGEYARMLPAGDLRAIEMDMALMGVIAAHESATADFLGRYGLSRSRFAVLRGLFFAEDQQLAMTHISRKVNVTLTNMARLVDSLEADGLVSRCEDAADRRVVNVRLTPEGEALVERIVPDLAVRSNARWGRFTPVERLVLRTLLLSLRDGLRESLQERQP